MGGKKMSHSKDYRFVLRVKRNVLTKSIIDHVLAGNFRSAQRAAKLYQIIDKKVKACY